MTYPRYTRRIGKRSVGFWRACIWGVYIKVSGLLLTIFGLSTKINPLDISFDNVEVYGEGAMVPVTAWSADAQQGSGSWGNSGWENRTFRVLLEGASITKDGDSCYLTLKGRTTGN